MKDAVLLEVTVECEPGHGGEREPRRFHLGGRAREVRIVLDRWVGPDHRYFRLLADDGGVYILRHDEARTFWELTLFDGRGSAGEVDSPDRLPT